MTPYATKTVEEVIDKLIDYRGKTPVKTASGIKLVTAKVIKDGFIVDGTHEYIAQRDYDSWMQRGLPQQGDILITTEAPLGQVAQLRTPEKIALAQRVILLRGRQSIIDQSYFYYALRSPLVQAALNARSSGTTVLGIKQSELRQVDIPCPCLPIQKTIAAILSPYDELIENNNRRIKILEEITQMIYREWFVEFRFPGHKQNGMNEPGIKDWKRISIEEVCVSVDDGDWIETKDQGGSDYRLLQISNIGLNSFIETGNYRFVSNETFLKLKCKEVVPGHILIARMPTPIGRAWLVTTQPWKRITAVDVAILAPDVSRVTATYLLHFLNSEETLSGFARKASGTTRARITRKQIASTALLLPPLDLQKRFAGLAQPINNFMAVLRDLNSNLSRTRDLLLPKLISGEISVEHFETNAAALTA